MPQACLSIGSNLQPRENIQRCLDLIRAHPQVRRAAFSPVYENAAVGPAGQPAFWNLAAMIDTPLDAETLFDLCRDWEHRLGRTRGDDKYAPRCIDIDLMALDDLVVETPRFRLPHPQLATQAFVLYPLSRIAPALRHPADGRTVAELLGSLDWNPSAFVEVSF